MATAGLHKIEIEMPDEAFAHRRWEPATIAEEMRLLWLVEEVRNRRLGFSKAAELGKVPQGRFLDFMREHRVTPFDLDEDELALELV